MPARVVAIANRYPRLRLDRRALSRALHALDTDFRPLHGDRLAKSASAGSKIENRHPLIPPGELSLVFLTDPDLAQLHADFLSDPTATDVITFEGDANHGVAGEICISVDAALRHLSSRSAASNSRESDFSAELLLYVVHGWLHLAGYDDLEPAKKRIMRRAESRALRLLGPLVIATLRPAKR